MKTSNLFTRRLVANAALVVVVALLSAGCGSSGTPTPAPNTPPTLAFRTPTLDQEGAVGMVVGLMYVANDAEDVAMTSVYADRDGDIATTGDQISIVQNKPEANG